MVWKKRHCVKEKTAMQDAEGSYSCGAPRAEETRGAPEKPLMRGYDFGGSAAWSSAANKMSVRIAALPKDSGTGKKSELYQNGLYGSCAHTLANSAEHPEGRSKGSWWASNSRRNAWSIKPPRPTSEVMSSRICWFRSVTCPRFSILAWGFP